MEEILAHSYYRYSVYQERPGVYALVAYCAHYCVPAPSFWLFFFEAVPRSPVRCRLLSANCCWTALRDVIELSSAVCCCCLLQLPRARVGVHWLVFLLAGLPPSHLCARSCAHLWASALSSRCRVEYEDNLIDYSSLSSLRLEFLPVVSHTVFCFGLFCCRRLLPVNYVL